MCFMFSPLRVCAGRRIKSGQYIKLGFGKIGYFGGGSGWWFSVDGWQWWLEGWQGPSVKLPAVHADEGVGNRNEEARLGQGDGLVGWTKNPIRYGFQTGLTVLPLISFVRFVQLSPLADKT